jgi:hypothetical protein
VKSLVCSRAIHDALKADDREWSRLPLVGVQHFEAEGGEPAESLEIRNCVCGSSLCRAVRQ